MSKIVCSILRAARSPIPGPRLAKYTSWWMKWRELQAHGNFVQVTHQMHKKYGPIVQLSPREISFNHIDALRDIYTKPRGGLDGSFEVSLLEQYGSENLVSTLDSKLHAARRKGVVGLYASPTISSPASQAVLKLNIDQLMNVLDAEASKSPTGMVNVFPLLKYLAADVMIHMVYGPEKAPNFLTNAESRVMLKSLEVQVVQQTFSIIGIVVRWFPGVLLALLRLFKPRSEIGDFGMERVLNAVATGPEGQQENATHLQHLLAMFRKDGPSPVIPSTTYIASDCLDHFLAGTLTTADLLAALIWRLSLPENKVVQAKLRQELHDAGVLPGTDVDSSFLQKLPYLNCVLRETFRTDPPIQFGPPRLVKTKNEPVVVMGLTIEPGTTISAQPYTLHRDPETFPDPDIWKPERWDIPTTSPEARRMQRMLMPFGAGPRMCTGMHLAWAEIRLTAARIYSTLETSLDDIWLDGDGNLLPKEKRKSLFPTTGKAPIIFRKI
ncbi:hypothetical protein AJ80_01485 [Polytolypa hystricis UAMH7299]|uniref:Cytochrome P450 n=1 Tax=Polytolypa hystricis (strain UAMH7299) TaxID=1447883 RepID=A0A2B7Z1F1_POLH7|nr:hypothetical protein AJ80_01485 [Polytolypa hystricis UAMH7299]